MFVFGFLMLLFVLQLIRFVFSSCSRHWNIWAIRVEPSRNDKIDSNMTGLVLKLLLEFIELVLKALDPMALALKLFKPTALVLPAEFLVLKQSAQHKSLDTISNLIPSIALNLRLKSINYHRIWKLTSGFDLSTD